VAVVVITGTSSGIGLAAALEFGRRGHRVYATLRNLAKAGPLEEATREEGLDLEVIALDVTDPESIGAALAEIHGRESAIDVLVNNAGISGAAPLEEVPEPEHRAMFEANYWGPIRLISGVLPGMRERRSGAIINVSSVVGRVPLVCQVPYAASKHALEAASECLAQELVGHGIRVAIVEPGVFQTQIWENSAPATRFDRSSPYKSVMRRNGRLFSRLLKSPGDPVDVARVIYEAATSERPQLRYVVGWDAERLIEGRSHISDEAWIGLSEDLPDEEYNARFRAYFGIEF